MCAGLQAQLHIKYNGKEINYKGDEIEYAFIQNNNFTDSALLNIKKSEWKDLVNNKIVVSNIPSCVWLKIPINNILKYGSFNFVDINNPHINNLRCWIVKNDTIIKSFSLTGDNQTFNTRPLTTSTFVFPVAGDIYKNCSFIIATDKRFTKLDLPIFFNSENYYIQQAETKKLVIGMFLGIGFFLLLFNFYLLISIKQKLYLWYSLYLLLVIGYVCTDMGLLFKYVYSNAPYINDIIRPSTFALSFVPLLLFFNQLLSIPILQPKLYTFNKRLLLFYFSLFVVAVATAAFGNYKIQQIWLYINRIITPLVLIIILAEAIYCFIKKIRFAFFAVLSFFSLVLFFSIYSFHQNGLIVQNNFTGFSQYFGLAFEAFIIAFSLAWRYKLYKEDSERLLKENLEQQENIFKETAAWQEKEMQRMSSLLHDTVGANLGFLRLETDNMNLSVGGRNKIAEHITRIGNEVRNMSHSFSPIVLHDKGLYAAINEMVNSIKNNSTINLQHEWLGEQQKLNLQYEIIIYRIVQEILQNLLKHSKAKNAFLQIIIQQKLISIYAEDDGVGISNNENNNGVGLKSIENLVHLLKGTYRVQSTEQDGFNISIEFNQQNNEKI